MNLRVLRPHYAVFDNVLSAQEMDELLHLANRTSFRSVHHSSVSKVWRLHDGEPLRSVESPYYEPDSDICSASGLRPIVKAILSGVEQAPGIIGPDWTTLTLGMWVYPRGTALSLHVDGRESYTGAFTFFFHPEWHYSWGGQLFVFDPEYVQPPRQHRPWLVGQREENTNIMSHGMADCIFPSPNRLVLIAPNAYHLVTRVDESAGLASRISVAGFFRRRNAQASTD